MSKTQTWFNILHAGYDCPSATLALTYKTDIPVYLTTNAMNERFGISRQH